MENQGRWLLGFSRFVLQRYRHDRCQAIAANLTLTSLFALVPLMTLMVSVFKLLPGMRSARRQLNDFLFEHFFPGSGDSVQTYVMQFVTRAENMKLAGSIALIFSALWLMNTIDRAFNSIWATRSRARVGRKFILYWSVLTLGPLLLGLSIVISSYFGSLPYLRGAAELARSSLVDFLPFILTVLGLVVLYSWLPNRRVRPIHAWISASLAAMLFELAKWGFGIFLAQFPTYQKIFGAVAFLPIMVIWVYLSWTVVLLGAEVCHALGIYRLTGFGIKDPFLLAVDMLQKISAGQRKMHRITAEELLAQTGNEHAPEILATLERNGFIGRVREDELVIAYAGETLDFATLYLNLPWRLPTAADASRELGEKHPLVPLLVIAEDSLRRDLAQPLSRSLLAHE
jgi:membrane protein